MVTFRRPYSRIVMSYVLSVLIPLMSVGLMLQLMHNQTSLDYDNILGATAALAGIVMVACIYFLVLKDAVKISVSESMLIYYQFGKLRHTYHLKDYQIETYAEGSRMDLVLFAYTGGEKVVIHCRPLGRDNFEALVQRLNQIKTNT